MKKMDPTQNELLSSLFKIDKAGFHRCLEPTMQCQNAAINAHSIQNSRVLDLLAEDGHVVSFAHRVDAETGPYIEFGSIGRNKASTFAGLCAEHDRRIFAPIDTQEIEQGNPEQLFLLAYRAVVRELHATMEGAVKVQTGYLKRVELGLSPSNQPSKMGMFAVQRMIVSYETFQYKAEYDKALLTRSFDLIQHDILTLENQPPTVAASALFSLDNLRVQDDVVRVVLNILPQKNDTTVVIFSYLRRDAASARSALSRIFNATGHFQKYGLSRTLLNYCDNFVIAPAYFSKWSDRKRAVIGEYFAKTVFENDLSYEDEDLFLF